MNTDWTLVYLYIYIAIGSYVTHVRTLILYSYLMNISRLSLVCMGINIETMLLLWATICGKCSYDCIVLFSGHAHLMLFYF